MKPLCEAQEIALLIDIMRRKFTCKICKERKFSDLKCITDIKQYKRICRSCYLQAFDQWAKRGWKGGLREYLHVLEQK